MITANKAKDLASKAPTFNLSTKRFLERTIEDSAMQGLMDIVIDLTGFQADIQDFLTGAGFILTPVSIGNITLTKISWDI